ncbi:putative KAP-like P-loop ATPase [Mucilaginibacter oryzae]|uniref:Putative KAP-like P-loop ATPase n=1 Tax=Mucilaginibacter oryzae TaxID=468058 RepID=A0A316HE63_9SPHI|nr:P-loop NTPase fold protein [Mucilaginibacter oryzae]PWK78677.1 putative KAP-like P-loop ATPase [Mucilaginibacter oryzae]
MSTQSNFSSDKPVINQEDDQFQRYNFSKRIAQTIINRKSSDCIVLGIYGAWGEGKTSVVNFIEKELNQDATVVSVKFNPWRYNDENALLMQFFQSLANGLDTKLKTRSEDIGSLLKKYGGLLSFNIPYVGNPGEKIKQAGELLDGLDIETLRSRIEKALIESNQKIAVFIDDIDRLDKQEIHSIFRLVKLNADFSNITYVLSFDEKMVSSAIGERFGDGDSVSGQSFLEKIIQIPLKIPVAQPEALTKFCYKFINDCYSENGLNLPDSQIERFGRQFNSNILIQLKTPRLAVRYGNSISFAVPLLIGEVNIVDLWLLEAVKIFYPTFYDFIKANPIFFIGMYYDRYFETKDIDKSEQFIKQIDNLSASFSNIEKEAIKDLLVELFPSLSGVFSHYVQSHSVDWDKEKRICSPKYFNRYFTYSVIKGELSDIEFENFILSVSDNSISEVYEKIKALIEESSPEAFLNKIRLLERELDWNIALKISKAIVAHSELFPKNEDLFRLDFEHPNGQVVVFISQIIRNQSDVEERLMVAKELIETATPMSFACNLYRRIVPNLYDDRGEETIFTKDEFKLINKTLIARALKQANGEPLLEKFPEECLLLFSAWRDVDETRFNDYIRNFLNNYPSKVDSLIWAYTPEAQSSRYPKPYKTNLTQVRFKYLISIIDKHIIYDAIKIVHKEEELNSVEVVWADGYDKNPSEINAIRQYVYWYNHSS